MTRWDKQVVRNAALSLRGKRLVVAGLGLFGGGEAAVRYLVEQGADVLLTDLKTEEQLVEPLRSLSGLDIEYKLGRHDEADFTGADLIVANPAIPFRSPYLQAAVEADVVVTTEIGLFAAAFPGKTVAVTGTSGKTTTTTLLGHTVANTIPDTLVGGNMGVSLLGNLASSTDTTTAVLELSSFQLRYLGFMGWRPDIGVVTNFTPNHLDVHDDLEDYRVCKQQLVAHQTRKDVAVLNQNDSEVADWAAESDAVVLGFGSERRDIDGVYVDGEAIVSRIGGRVREICGVDDLSLPGAHNRMNACAAASASIAAGVDLETIAEVLATFEGVEHRLERCGVRDGVTFYNDSIATSPERTIVALEALDQPIVLIAGGSDKGLDYSEMGKVLARSARRVVLIGETSAAIEAAVGDVPVDRAGSLEDAFELAVSHARRGDAVLLSPASASYDMFSNFEERGRRFKSLVDQLC